MEQRTILPRRYKSRSLHKAFIKGGIPLLVRFSTLILINKPLIIHLYILFTIVIKYHTLETSAKWHFISWKYNLMIDSVEDYVRKWTKRETEEFVKRITSSIQIRKSKLIWQLVKSHIYIQRSGYCRYFVRHLRLICFRASR